MIHTTKTQENEDLMTCMSIFPTILRCESSCMCFKKVKEWFLTKTYVKKDGENVLKQRNPSYEGK